MGSVKFPNPNSATLQQKKRTQVSEENNNLRLTILYGKYNKFRIIKEY